MSSEKAKFKKNQVVWAKLKGYPWWPSVVAQTKIKESTNQEEVLVNFLNENSHCTLPRDKIMDFKENFDMIYKKNSALKKKKLGEAVQMGKRISQGETTFEEERKKYVKKPPKKSQEDDDSDSSDMDDSEEEDTKTKKLNVNKKKTGRKTTKKISKKSRQSKSMGKKAKKAGKKKGSDNEDEQDSQSEDSSMNDEENSENSEESQNSQEVEEEEEEKKSNSANKQKKKDEDNSKKNDSAIKSGNESSDEEDQNENESGEEIQEKKKKGQLNAMDEEEQKITRITRQTKKEIHTPTTNSILIDQIDNINSIRNGKKPNKKVEKLILESENFVNSKIVGSHNAAAGQTGTPTQQKDIILTRNTRSQSHQKNDNSEQEDFMESHDQETGKQTQQKKIQMDEEVEQEQKVQQEQSQEQKKTQNQKSVTDNNSNNIEEEEAQENGEHETKMEVEDHAEKNSNQKQEVSTIQALRETRTNKRNQNKKVSYQNNFSDDEEENLSVPNKKKNDGQDEGTFQNFTQNNSINSPMLRSIRNTNYKNAKLIPNKFGLRGTINNSNETKNSKISNNNESTKSSPSQNDPIDIEDKTYNSKKQKVENGENNQSNNLLIINNILNIFNKNSFTFQNNNTQQLVEMQQKAEKIKKFEKKLENLFQDFTPKVATKNVQQESNELTKEQSNNNNSNSENNNKISQSKNTQQKYVENITLVKRLDKICDEFNQFQDIHDLICYENTSIGKFFNCFLVIFTSTLLTTQLQQSVKEKIEQILNNIVTITIKNLTSIESYCSKNEIINQKVKGINQQHGSYYNFIQNTYINNADKAQTQNDSSVGGNEELGMETPQKYSNKEYNIQQNQEKQETIHLRRKVCKKMSSLLQSVYDKDKKTAQSITLRLESEIKLIDPDIDKKYKNSVRVLMLMLQKKQLTDNQMIILQDKELQFNLTQWLRDYQKYQQNNESNLNKNDDNQNPTQSDNENENTKDNCLRNEEPYTIKQSEMTENICISTIEN